MVGLQSSLEKSEVFVMPERDDDVKMIGIWGPAGIEALEMLCLSAFKQRSVPDGFEEVARKVAELCGNLPLGFLLWVHLCVGRARNEWEVQISRIESSLDRKLRTY
ncbi:unnamed protein product [Microthlaspi erraticum]|uniref:NB-ARC domain-containing protein n=1 Tax=Microthlaspi erraticum TaxID=1685480 RepID=A0A6D2JYQ8_9BRAS|nr:unnamed protein product [Microthlaspi erraticum]